MVAIPAVLEAGATAKLCADLMQPNEALTMTTSLVYKKRTTLFKWTSRKDLHTCAQFQVPLVQNDEVWNFEVEVQGSLFSSKEVRKVMIRVYQPMTFVQTDKPIYLPGQTVLFRVVTLDTQLRPASRLYSIIEITDPINNRIGQWLNETSSGKILQLSYSLSSEVREGTYQIIVSAGENKIIQSFKVERYVLPKFEVTINAAEEASLVQEEVKAEVCAKYTYGQSVPGSVKVQMCRPLQEYIFGLNGVPDVPPPCYEETKQADKRGCASFTFKMSRFTKIDQKVLQDLLVLRASVEEEGTGVSLSQEKNITISYVVGKLSFIDTPKLYKQGSTVKGKVKAVSYSGAPVPRIPLYLFEGEVWSSHLLQNLTTDIYGIAAFSVSTADHSGNIHLQVSTTPTLEYPGYRVPYYEAQDQILSMVQPFSPDTATVGFLEVMKEDDPLPCDKEQDIFIRYTIVGEARGSVDLMYLVLSRGAITMQGFKQINIQDTSVTEGEVSFKLKVAPEMAPAVHIVAYAILPSETVIASSADFPTEKCFSNKVSLKFTPSSAVPQEDVTMRVMAVPGSLCGLSIVDKSVFVKEPGTGLDAGKIFNLLPVTSGSYIPYEVQDPTECLTVRTKRSILPPYPGGGDSDPYTVFQNAGLKMATNLFVQMPSCVKFKGREYYQGRFGFGLPLMSKELAPALAAPVPSNTPAQSVVTIRTFFPETWLWDLVELGESGTKDVSLTAPDTITTWETEAFCLSPQGFGLAPRTGIAVFQPFFLELTLPYSIIRGERFRLKATVFNYLTSCIMVTVTPAPSLDYTLTPFSGDQYRACLCGSERKTFSWTMTPSVLGTVNVTVTAEASRGSCGNNIVSVPDRGRIDVVTKALIVKAEGTEVTETYNWLLCPKGQALMDKMDVRLPDNVVAGSASASVSVLGDILGRALQNLDRLLQMPSGCGEQNMVLLAPDIYILQYLTNTGQLTPAIKEKATNFLISGYQRELNYKLDNGSFSTFGVPPGNTWLTVFVLRSFVKAQSFIYIDPNVIEQSKTWLVNQQQENGCFLQSGKIYDNGIQGGVSSSVALSAYITAAFLEMKGSVNDPVIRKGLSCLKESIGDLSNTYTTALLAYVFTLARDVRTRARLLQHLDTVAIKQGGSLHWSQTSAETSASLSVEISAYVLLAKLSSSPTAEDLGYASLIVRWLTSQQNYYGGFSSTQDTVVALQALALYTTLVFSSMGSSTVTVQSSRGLLVFDVNQKNKLLYQEKMLQGVTGSYSLEVKGTACVSVQIALHYNIPTPTKATTLGVRVRPVADCNDKSPRLTLNIIVLYSGKETSTNMVILDIKMLSGFIPDPESMNKLKGALLVDRVEQEEDHIVVYIQELPKAIPVNLQLVLVQELPVQNLKPAVVEIYDYYQPSDQAKTEYIYPCAAA